MDNSGNMLDQEPLKNSKNLSPKRSGKILNQCLSGNLLTLLCELKFLVFWSVLGKVFDFIISI